MSSRRQTMKRFLLYFFLTLFLMSLLVVIVIIGLLFASSTPSTVHHQQLYSLDDLRAELENSSPCRGVAHGHKGSWLSVYVVVIMAMDSRTSVNSFAFIKCCTDNRFLLQKADYFTLDESILSYAKTSKKIRFLLQPLIERAERFVPKKAQKRSNILFRATPFLRQLASKKAIHRLLLRTRSVLRHSPFRMRSREATIQASVDEAADLWLSGVFLTGRTYRTNHSQLAVAELSSGSLRVAIPLASSSRNNPQPKTGEQASSLKDASKDVQEDSGISKKKDKSSVERNNLERKVKRDIPETKYLSREGTRDLQSYNKSIYQAKNIVIQKTSYDSSISVIPVFNNSLIKTPDQVLNDNSQHTVLPVLNTTQEGLLSILYKKLKLHRNANKWNSSKLKDNNSLDPSKNFGYFVNKLCKFQNPKIRPKLAKTVSNFIPMNYKEPFLEDENPFLKNKKPFLEDKKPFLDNEKPLVHNKKPFLGNKKIFLEDEKSYLAAKKTSFKNIEPFLADNSIASITSNQFAAMAKEDLFHIEKQIKINSLDDIHTKFKNNILTPSSTKRRNPFFNVSFIDDVSLLKTHQKNFLFNSRDVKIYSNQSLNYNTQNKQNSYQTKYKNMFLTPNTIETNNADELKTMIELNTNAKHHSNFRRKNIFHSKIEKIKNILFIFLDFNYCRKGLLRVQSDEDGKILIITRADKSQFEIYINSHFNINRSKEYEYIIKTLKSLFRDIKMVNTLQKKGKIKELYSSFKTWLQANCIKLTVLPKIVTVKRQLIRKYKYSTMKLENFGSGVYISTDFAESILGKKSNNFPDWKISRNFPHICFVHDGNLNSDDASYYFKNCFLENGAKNFIYKINAENWKGKGGKNLHNANFDGILSQVYEPLFTNKRSKERIKDNKHGIRNKGKEANSGGISGERTTDSNMRLEKLRKVNERKNKIYFLIIETMKDRRHNQTNSLINTENVKIIRKNANSNEITLNKRLTLYVTKHFLDLKNCLKASDRKLWNKKENSKDKFQQRNVKKTREKSILSLFEVKRNSRSKTKGFQRETMIICNCLGYINKENKSKERQKNREKKRDSLPEAKNNYRMRCFLHNKSFKTLLSEHERVDSKLLLNDKGLTRHSNNSRFIFYLNICFIRPVKIRITHCLLEPFIILIRSNNLVAVSCSQIHSNRIKGEYESKARTPNRAQMDERTHSLQMQEAARRQRRTLSNVRPRKWRQIKIVEPRKWAVMLNSVPTESFTRVAAIPGLWPLPSHQQQDYFATVNATANDRSKLQAIEFAKKDKRQSIRNIALETRNVKNDRPAKNIQSREKTEENSEPDVFETTSEDNHLQDKDFCRKFWPFLARTPQNDYRNLPNSRQKIRRIVKKHKRESANQERNHVNNITSRCFAGFKIWLFATSSPLGIYPARVRVLLGANLSSSVGLPLQFRSVSSPPSSLQIMASNKSALSKRRSDVSPEVEDRVTSNPRMSHPTKTLNFQPSGPGPPLYSSDHFYGKSTRNPLNLMPQDRPDETTLSNENDELVNEKNNILPDRSTKLYEEVNLKRARPQSISDPHSKASVWTKGTLENIKSVVDSILKAIGSSSQNSLEHTGNSNVSYAGAKHVAPNNGTIIPTMRYETSYGELHRDSKNILNVTNRRKKLLPRKNKSNIDIINTSKNTSGQANPNVNYLARRPNAISNEPYFLKLLGNITNKDEIDTDNRRKGLETILTPLFNINHNSKTEDNKKANAVAKPNFSFNISNKILFKNLSKNYRKNLGTISSVTDLLFTVPNLRISNPEENSQIESELKLTEKLIQSSLTDFLKFSPENSVRVDATDKAQPGSQHILRNLVLPILGLDRNGFSESTETNKRLDGIEPLTKPMEELILQSSCLPTGSLGRFTIDDISYTVVGNDDKGNGTTRCWHEVTKVIDNHLSIPSVQGMDFLASAAFYFVASTANLIEAKSHVGYVKPLLFKAAADEMCARLPENLPDPLACLDYQFVAAILLHGFKLPEDKEIMVCDSVGDFRMNSALGAAVNFLQRQR